MTQKTALHVFAKPTTSTATCGKFVIATGIASNFSDFDVSETGTGMPCYCIQWNVSDKNTGAMFCAEIEEVRSSHNISTATATHRLHFVLVDKTKTVLLDQYQELNKVNAGDNGTHPFGRAFQDTTAFYMSDHHDPTQPPSAWSKIITLFWYNFVQGGTPTNPHSAHIITTRDFLIPDWFTPTDMSMEFVAIDGDVQFSKELAVDIELGEQFPADSSSAKVGTAMATRQADGSVVCASPCVTGFSAETSNSEQTLHGVSASTTSSTIGVSSVSPPPPPPPPTPTGKVAFTSAPKQNGLSISTPVKNDSTVVQQTQVLCSLKRADGHIIESGTGVFDLQPGEARSYVSISLQAYAGQGAFTGTVWIADGKGTLVGLPISITVTV